MELQRINSPSLEWLPKLKPKPWRVTQGLCAATLVAAGCVITAAGSAEAQVICDFNGYNGPNITCESNQVLEFGDKRVTFSQLPTVGSGTIGLASIVPDVFTLQFIFFQPILPPPPPPSTAFGPLLPVVNNAITSYVIDIVDNPGWIFSGVKIDSVDAGVLGTIVAKSELSNRFNTLTSNNGVPDPNTGDFASLNGLYNSLSVTDTYSVLGTGALTSFTNTYRQSLSAVPGPLPLAGVLAALAWSRRMRRRVKSAAAVRP